MRKGELQQSPLVEQSRFWFLSLQAASSTSVRSYQPRLLVLLQLFRPTLVARCAEPRNEHSKARTPGPHPLRGYPAYIIWYVAGSDLGASNTARRS